MDNNCDSKTYVAVALNAHFQQMINERIDEYEKLVDNLLENLLSRLKSEDDVSKSNGDCNLDEFSIARRKEFVKKLTRIREIFLGEFRNDLANLISSKYSNDMNAFDKNLSQESFDEFVNLFNQLSVSDSSEVKRETYSQVVDLFDQLEISTEETNRDGIELPEKSTSPSIEPVEFSDRSDDDISEIPQKIDVLDLTSNDGTSVDTKEISTVETNRDGIDLPEKSTSPSIEPADFSDGSDDDISEIPQKIDVFDLTSNDSTSVDTNESNEIIYDRQLTIKEEDDILRRNLEKVCKKIHPGGVRGDLSTKKEISSEIEFDSKENLDRRYEPFANDRKRTALEFSNFMVNRGFLKFEKRLSLEKLRSQYEQYEVEVKPKVSIAGQVLRVLKSIDVVKDSNNNGVEFKETFFLYRNHDFKVLPNDSRSFKGEILRILNPGYMMRQAKFRCATCKDCFCTDERFEAHNSSEMHILNTIYLKDKAWFKKEVDYLRIDGVPDSIVKQKESINCEISFVNVAKNRNKIYFCKIFELVHSGVEMRIEYGSNYCLEKRESFKIIMKAKYASITTSETLYPIVLKVFQSEVNEYEYILIEPHFKVNRASKSSVQPIPTHPPSLKDYRPPLKTQDANNKRCIIPESNNSRPQFPNVVSASQSSLKTQNAINKLLVDLSSGPKIAPDPRPQFPDEFSESQSLLKTQDTKNKRCILVDPSSGQQIVRDPRPQFPNGVNFSALPSSLKTQNANNKRLIVDPSSGQKIDFDDFSAFHTNIRIDRTASTDTWRVSKDVPIYDAPKREKQSVTGAEKKEKEKDETLKAPRIARALVMPKINLSLSPIPPVLRALVKRNFKTANLTWKPTEKILLERIRDSLCGEHTLRIQHNKDLLCERNYIERLHYMMWIEEYQVLDELRSYDQKDIDLLTDKLTHDLVGINVPGLSEGRPSILKGDYITLTVKSPKLLPKGFKKCEGSVQLIEEKAVYVKLRKTFFTETYWKYKADVEFKFNRTPLKMSHTALNRIHGMKWQQSLFPQNFERNPNNIELRSFFNESIGQNELQIQAVKNIVQNRASPAPYILFGPPGTGKTATLVEAISQIWETMKGSRICVCASSNTAADVIAKRLLQYIPMTDLIRIYGLSRNDAEITSELQGCCNYDAKLQEVYFPCPKELYSKRIIVMTPVTAGRFVLSNNLTFDYMFMDEAGHALEVDVLIPFIGFLRNDQCGLVLAGDPQQLGPVVRSPYANALGYDMSLLERLMTQCEIYKKDAITGNYNPKVITKLVNNYRSHETILRIPNKKFYDNELRAKAPVKVTSSLCRWKYLPSKGFPIIFHSVKGEEEKENNSPSYFNSSEVDVVAKYVRDLFNSKELQLDQSEVGIISPYRKQVHKIRQRLLRSFPKINVASVEEFQGQERKVIIISTVRSRHELLPTDYKYGLGFLKNEKRFNVAITRAIALLVVIGNPDVLQCDPHWREFLKYCTENSAFIGEPASGTVPDDFDPSANVDMHLGGFII